MFFYAHISDSILYFFFFTLFKYYILSLQNSITNIIHWYLLCAFALNLAVFLLEGKTSALTMNVVGVVKDRLLIGFLGLLLSTQSHPLICLGTSLLSWVFCAITIPNCRPWRRKRRRRRRHRLMKNKPRFWP